MISTVIESEEILTSKSFMKKRFTKCNSKTLTCSWIILSKEMTTKKMLINNTMMNNTEKRRNMSYRLTITNVKVAIHRPLKNPITAVIMII